MMTEIPDEDLNCKIDSLVREWDETMMPLPSLEAEPHLLISKVRKHYFEYLIRLLSVNYENNQNLLGKTIYLPSAIWRCAKYIEVNAAQSCMVAELYRRNVVTVVKELKSYTKKGKLYKKLFECLQRPPDNEKKLQASLDKPSGCNCPCTCNGLNNKRRKLSAPQKKSSTEIFPKVQSQNDPPFSQSQNDPPFSKNFDTFDSEKGFNIHYKIPAVINSKTEMPQIIMDKAPPNIKQVNSTHTSHLSVNTSSKLTPMPRMSIESQDSEDQVMMQLEQLFRADSNELEDDLFGGTLCDTIDSVTWDVQDHTKALFDGAVNTNDQPKTDTTADEHAAKIKSLDERLAMLETTGILSTATTVNKIENQAADSENKKHQKRPHKWLCEHYYQKLYLIEKMDEIRESNRKKHSRIKDKFIDLFGEDSDDEQEIMSPLEETPEFVLSCKERIAPWIVKLLTPYYVKGRIRGKALFKALAKHLIRLVYQCSRYPNQYEVNSFVTDFLKSHKMIRCEADFKEFKIENI